MLEILRRKLIVSCQALPDEPLYGSDTMAKMAKAASLGGASAIRANTVEDIKAIKKAVDKPIIGIIKAEYKDSEIYITPTIEEVDALVEVGVEIIAIDFTNRIRPNGQTLESFIKGLRCKYPKQLIMADISTLEEGIKAEMLGADLVSTTLSGYTSYSKQQEDPDFELVHELSCRLKIPVVAEGRIYSPEKARLALEAGAYAVVVGSAITRPLEITQRFKDEILRSE